MIIDLNSTHTLLDTHTHTHTHTHIHTHTHVHTHSILIIDDCWYSWIIDHRSLIHVYCLSWMINPLLSLATTHSHTYTHPYTHTYSYTHSHTHTHTHTHIHTFQLIDHWSSLGHRSWIIDHWCITCWWSLINPRTCIHHTRHPFPLSLIHISEPTRPY